METEGSVRVTSHAVGLVIYRVGDDGAVQFAVMDYTENDGRTTLRHPMEKGQAREAVEDTVKRLLNEEIGSKHKDTGGVILTEGTKQEVYRGFYDDERNPGGVHLKVFFAARIEGTLRDCKIVEKDPRGDEVIGPMKWVEASRVIGAMRSGHSPVVHLLATFRAMSRLACDPKVCDRYASLLSSREVLRLTRAEKRASEACFGDSEI